jgi:hypothetical protein
MSTQTVQRGLYRFFTKPLLDAERIRYIQQVQASNTQLAASSVNGQSFTFQVSGREIPLEQMADILADAYLQLGIMDYGVPTPTKTVSRF